MNESTDFTVVPNQGLDLVRANSKRAREFLAKLEGERTWAGPYTLVVETRLLMDFLYQIQEAHGFTFLHGPSNTVFTLEPAA